MGWGATHGTAGQARTATRPLTLTPGERRRWLTGLLLAAAAVLVTSPGARAAGLPVIPFPGTPAASPQSQIIFPSLRKADVASLIVVGSRSGPHAGRLVTLPDHAGTAFAPAGPFAPGERVHVTVGLSSPLAGLPAGPHWGAVSFWFGVARVIGPPRSPEPSRPRAGQASAVPDGTLLHSIPGVRPPTVKVTGDPDGPSGDIFLTPRNSYQRRVQLQQGPMILNSQGKVVWFRNLPGGLAMNLAVQRYQAEPVLTWWQGTADWRLSEDVVADSSYRTLAVLHAGNGYKTDSHDIQITPQNTALIEATNVVRANLREIGGSTHGGILDDIVQELDIKTGQVLWEWHSLGHIPLGASYTRPSKGRLFDYFHLNSVQELADGNILISSRHTWTVYEISKKTGVVISRIGGKHSSFTMGPGAHFSWQHDARLSGHTLSLFDDASDGPRAESAESSAKVLTLNWKKMTATLDRRYTHSPPVLAVSQGNTERLSNGDVFVGWGSEPEFSEYSPSGHQIFDGSLGAGVGTYRAYRFPWTGHPSTRPALAVSRSSGSAVTIYASWNGATRVSRWRVLAGRSPTKLTYLTRTGWTGLETAIRVRSQLPYFAVQALDSRGQVLSSSVVERR